MTQIKNPLFEKTLASEHIKLFFNNNPSFGNISECEIKNHGDICTDCYLSIRLPDLPWKDDIGKIIIKKAYVRIGLDIVETYDFDYMNIYNCSTSSDEKIKMFNKIISLNKKNGLMIPLKFFFNKYSDNFLQLIKQNHNNRVAIGIEFEKIENLVNGSKNIDLTKYYIIDSSITINYIYLNYNKRQEIYSSTCSQTVDCVKMQQFDILNDTIIHNVHTILAYDYLYKNNIGIFGLKDIHNLIFSFLGYHLIPKEQEQELDFDLEFNQTIKELIWVITSDDKPLQYSNMILHDKISINGNVRIENDSNYFSSYQPYINHTNTVEGTSLYSFSLFPEENKVNGYSNFGQEDKSTLHLKILCPFDKFYKLKVYAIQQAKYTVDNVHQTLQHL